MKISTKQEALDIFEDKRKEWLENARWHAVRLARENNGFCNIDLVRKHVAAPMDTSPSVFGAVFNTPYFEASGFMQTTREEAHGRPIRIFRLIESMVPDKWKLYRPTLSGQLTFV